MGKYPQQRTANLPAGIQAFIQAQGFGLNSSTPVCKIGVVGGLQQKVLLANRTQLLTALFNTEGQVNGLTNNPLTTWYILTALDNKSNLTYEAPTDANGTIYKSVLSGQLYYHSTVANQFFARMINQPMAAIVLDGAGIYWLIGNDQPLRRVNLIATTGIGEPDLNGYTWNLETKERTPPLEILPTVVNNLILNPNVNCDLPYSGTTNILTFGTCNISAFGSIII